MQKNNLDETTNLLLNNEYSLNDNDEVDEEIEYKNTYKNKDVDTEKIYEKGFSTKPGNSGLGLWKVRQILIRNNNLNLFTTKNDEYFKQQLEIY